jgi:hypothetical protein
MDVNLDDIVIADHHEGLAMGGEGSSGISFR